VRLLNFVGKPRQYREIDSEGLSASCPSSDDRSARPFGRKTAQDTLGRFDLKLCELALTVACASV
jgi:hypothetical protein